MTDLNSLIPPLTPGERLLFLAEKARLTNRLPLHISENNGLKDIFGTLAITDRRITIIEKKGFLSSNRTFEATFSSEYAGQAIKESMAKNSELMQQAKNKSVFSRNRWLAQNGFRVSVDILMGANLQKSVVGYVRTFTGGSKALYGKEILNIQLYHAYVDSKTRQNIENARKLKHEIDDNVPGSDNIFNVLASTSPGLMVSYLLNSEYELHIQKPITLASGVETTDFTADENKWLLPIVQKYKQNEANFYIPLLEIVNARTQEMRELIKDYENRPI